MELLEELTLRGVAENMGSSLPMCSDTEKGRLVPSDTFDHELLERLFLLDAREKAVLPNGYSGIRVPRVRIFGNRESGV